MKYYIYISDAKVDMLLRQVPHDIKKKTATELGFDLKFLKASRKTEEESDDNRISRLETVVSFIREYGNVGTIDKPDDFIDDTSLVSFGPEHWCDMAYFTGETERTIFGLAGSSWHLVGNNQAQTKWPSGSAVNSISGWLTEHDLGLQIPDADSKVFHSMCGLLRDAIRNRMPQQRLEFLAKRLLYREEHDDFWSSRKVNVLLATPLYVAMTD